MEEVDCHSGIVGSDMVLFSNQELTPLPTEEEARVWLKQQTESVAVLEAAFSQTLREYIMQCDEWQVREARKGSTRYHLQITTLLVAPDGAVSAITIEFAPNHEDANEAIVSYIREVRGGEACPREVADIVKQHTQNTVIIEYFTADCVEVRGQYMEDSSDTFQLVLGSDWEKGVKWGSIDYENRRRAVDEGMSYCSMSMEGDDTFIDELPSIVLNSVRLIIAHQAAEKETRWMEYREIYDIWQVTKDETQKKRLQANMEQILDGRDWRVSLEDYERIVREHSQTYTWDESALQALKTAIDARRSATLDMSHIEYFTTLPDPRLAVYLKSVSTLGLVVETLRQLGPGQTNKELQ